MELIGLSGYARSGKDEAAKVLVEEFGFRRVAFADKLKQFLYALNPMVDVEYEVIDDKALRRGTARKRRVQEVIDAFGWDGYKETQYLDEVRGLLQRTGTEGGRETLWDSIWVDAALGFEGLDDKIVVTDCRFENEAKGVIDRGGQVWRVNRKGIGPANDHISEVGLDDWPFDLILENNSSLKDYHERIRGALTYSRLS
jgi:hypothetical protein